MGNPLPLIPARSPLLSGILLTYFSDLYAVPEQNQAFSPPPIQLVKVALSWLQDNPDLCGAQGQAENQGVVTMLGRSPVSGLMVWSVLSPLVCGDQDAMAYSQLHFNLLQHITEENAQFSIPGGFLSNLTETLLSTLNSRNFTEQQINTTLDRFGQMLQAARAANSRVDQDLVLLINQLPYNRLINIILSNIS